MQRVSPVKMGDFAVSTDSQEFRKRLVAYRPLVYLTDKEGTCRISPSEHGKCTYVTPEWCLVISTYPKRKLEWLGGGPELRSGKNSLSVRVLMEYMIAIGRLQRICSKYRMTRFLCS